MQSNDTIKKTHLSNEFHKIFKKQENVDNYFFVLLKTLYLSIKIL